MDPGAGSRIPGWRRHDEQVARAAHADVGEPARFRRALPLALPRLLGSGDPVEDRYTRRMATEDLWPVPHDALRERRFHIEGAGRRLDSCVPEPLPPRVVEVGGDHHRPLEALRLVVGQHMHGVAAGEHGLQVEFGRARVLEPEEEAGQGGGLVLRDAVALVLDSKVQEGIQVPKPLRGLEVYQDPRQSPPREARRG